MALDKEYWNIPKPSDDLLMAQGTNLTVFVDHADNSLVWGLGASDVTAIAGVFIASLALGVSVWQWLSARKQNRLMVTPHIILSRATVVGTRSIEVSLKNNGVGPAVIDRCVLKLAGLELNNKDIDIHFFRKHSGDISDVDVNLMGGFPYFLPNTDQHLLIRIIFIEQETYEKLGKDLNSYLALIDIDVAYTDIYGKRFPDVKTNNSTP